MTLKSKITIAPHLYSVTTLPSKTHTTDVIYIDVFGMCKCENLRRQKY